MFFIFWLNTIFLWWKYVITPFATVLSRTIKLEQQIWIYIVPYVNCVIVCRHIIESLRFLPKLLFPERSPDWSRQFIMSSRHFFLFQIRLANKSILDVVFISPQPRIILMIIVIKTIHAMYLIYYQDTPTIKIRY